MAQPFAGDATNGAIPLHKSVLDSEVNDFSRAEIDTSAPFESVKEAASRFGGIGFWRPNPVIKHTCSSSSDYASQPLEHGSDTLDIMKLEEQAAQLEKDLIAKEKETLDVLKELEDTKMVVEELKATLQKETSEVGAEFDQKNADLVVNIEEMKDQSACGGLDLCPSSSTPGLILIELKQAKVNLTRSTNDLADIRATVESYNKKIEKERISLEKTRERLSSNSMKILSLEKELNQTNDKLQVLKGANGGPSDISREMQRLSSEAEKFKEVGKAAKSEVLRAVSEIEEAKIRIKTAEFRLVAARKMKEAAKATEAVALADIRALSKHESSSVTNQPNTEMLTITREEYLSLMSRVQEAEEAYQRKVMDGNLQVDEATMSKAEILKKVEEATEEVKTSRKALEEALSKVDAANRCKLEVEAALRKWRSERGQKRHSSNNSTKFKNPYPSAHLRKEPPCHVFGVNDVDIVNDEDMKPILKPTLSIGQILSRKLLVHADEKTAVKKVSLGQMVGKYSSELLVHADEKTAVKKVSLGQMVGKYSSAGHSCMDGNAKQLSAKRKKFGFARISLLVAKQSKKKKKPSGTL